MRFRPTCGWCKNYEEFVENPILRTLIQCLKKMCEYLASSAIAINIENTSNDSNSTLMSVIQDGVNIKDDYTSIMGPHLGLFPPKLQKVNSRRASKEERNAQPHEEQSNEDKGEGQPGGSGCSTKREQNKSTETRTKKNSSEEKMHTNDKQEESNQDTDNKSESPITPPERRGYRRKKRCSDRFGGSERGSPKKHTNGTNHKSGKSDNENVLNETSLYETVAAEHDYNMELSTADSPNPLKVRIRKIEGDHESLVKRSQHVAEPVFDNIPVNNFLNGDMDSIDIHIPSEMDNNNDVSLTNSIIEEQSKNNKKKPMITGCRCGLATPHPGKLTCCGQRCPCYSSFKGCMECKCRGCRNPRGDKPSPNSLKVQLQQHNLTTQSLLPFVGSTPQLIITPIKLEHHGDSDIDITDS